jgi:anaerobic selenocysteine-containing dehydrogenase
VSVAPAAFQGDESQYPYYLYLYVPALMGTGLEPSLPWLQGSPEPMTSMAWQTWVEINPATAQKLGVKKGDVVRITTPQGNIEAPVYVYPAIRADTIAIPLGRGHSEGGRFAQSQEGGNPLQLLGTQMDSTNTNLAWGTQRARVERTGRWVNMATMEWTPGVEQGFVNREFPGD